MSLEITPINLGGLLGYGVNCYLLKTASGFILIDTGISPKRTLLDLRHRLPALNEAAGS